MASIIRKSWSRGEESAPEGYTGFYFGEVMYRVIVDAPERVEDENEALWCADFESRAARRREHYACRGGADPARAHRPHPRHRRLGRRHINSHRIPSLPQLVSAPTAVCSPSPLLLWRCTSSDRCYRHLLLARACHTPCFALLRKKLRWSANYICQPTPTFRS